MLSNNLEIVELDEPITPIYKEAYDAVEADVNNIVDYVYLADSDENGLYDFLEADFNDRRFEQGDIKIVDDKIVLRSASSYFNKYAPIRSIYRLSPCIFALCLSNLDALTLSLFDLLSFKLREGSKHSEHKLSRRSSRWGNF